MLNQERCMEIRILYKQGKSIKAIAQITGHSRNTVRRYLVVYRSFCNFIFDRFVVGTVELWSRDQRVWSNGGLVGTTYPRFVHTARRALIGPSGPVHKSTVDGAAMAEPSGYPSESELEICKQKEKHKWLSK